MTFYYILNYIFSISYTHAKRKAEHEKKSLNVMYYTYYQKYNYSILVINYSPPPPPPPPPLLLLRSFCSSLSHTKNIQYFIIF